MAPKIKHTKYLIYVLKTMELSFTTKVFNKNFSYEIFKHKNFLIYGIHIQILSVYSFINCHFVDLSLPMSNATTRWALSSAVNQQSPVSTFQSMHTLQHTTITGSYKTGFHLVQWHHTWHWSQTSRFSTTGPPPYLYNCWARTGDTLKRILLIATVLSGEELPSHKFLFVVSPLHLISCYSYDLMITDGKDQQQVSGTATSKPPGCCIK